MAEGRIQIDIPELDELDQRIADLQDQIAAMQAPATAPYVVLKQETPQAIPAGEWVPLRFGAALTDPFGWHTVTDLDDPASALIIPSGLPWGGLPVLLAWLVHWESEPGVTQYLSQVCRDPYGVPDTTATSDTLPTPGKQFIRGAWFLEARNGVPLAIRVRQENPTGAPRTVSLAEFKVWCPT